MNRMHRLVVAGCLAACAAPPRPPEPRPAADIAWEREGLAFFDAMLAEAKASRRPLLLGLSGGDF